MVRIDRTQWLRDNNWKLILQVHDELMLEGPEESSQEAFRLVKHLMEHPFGENIRLLLPLDVDAKICQNWYEAK